MLWWFAETTLVAAGLAALAGLACRSRRLGPEARHALWLVVMLKLAMPPLVAWPRSPREARPAPNLSASANRSAPATRPAKPPPIAPDASPAVEVPPIPDPPAGPWAGLEEPTALPAPLVDSQISGIPDFKPADPRPGPGPTGRPAEVISNKVNSDSFDLRSAIWNLPSTLPPILLGLWLAGSLAVVARRAFGVARFRKSLRGSCPAPAWLVEEARAIGERLGVRPPPILVAPGVASPMLWCLGRPRLILPASLIGRLDSDRWSGVLAHELAHLARRDHWVVRLELLVEAAWWWNPLFHLARRRLRVEAEQAADARVIRAQPDRRFAYAEALVDICEHLARSAIPSPALGVGGAEASRTLEARLLMILRDPIPRPPGRRAALAAGLLAALALPTWTLGQQPEPSPKPSATEPSPKPEEPKAPPKPEAPAKPSDPAPEPRPVASRPTSPVPTIDEIRAGFAKRLEAAARLGFRYSVASRGGPAVVVVNGGNRESVRVQVADVLLGSGVSSRLDVLSSPAIPELVESGRATPWFRQFVARDPSGLVTFQESSTQAGPIPFRWQPGGGRASTFGDDLAVELLAGTGSQAFDQNRRIDPLLPRPRNVLDLAGASTLLLVPNAGSAQVEVAGTEVVEGREVVRVAWVAYRNDGQGGGGLRGLLWVAPSLGFAVIRSEAAQDASRVGAMNGRRSWRKTVSDFVEVGGLWLPRKVEGRTTSDGFGGSPMGVHEPTAYVATFEDYRVNPELPADAFHPKFPIEALDEQTGDFTTKPPESSPGLIERFRRAVTESPFGPPGDREVPEADRPRSGPGIGPGGFGGPGRPGGPILLDGDQELMRANPEFAKAMREFVQLAQRAKNPNDPEVQEAKRQTDEMRARLKAAAKPEAPSPASIPPGAQGPAPQGAAAPAPATDPARSVPPPGRAYADIAANVDEAPTGRLTLDAGKPDPFADPASRPAAPSPVAEPGKAGPKPADAPPDEAWLTRQVEERFRRDPEVIALARRSKEASDKKTQVGQVAHLANDPAERKAQQYLQNLENKYDQLWDLKGRQIREAILAQSETGRDELALLKARRDGKAAEVRKAEAARELAMAVVKRNVGLSKKGPNLVSREEVAKGEAGFAIAEAEVESKKADLAVADIGLDQARRRAGLAPGADLTPTAASPIAGGTLADLRDAVELMEVQLQGKQAELRGVEEKALAAESEKQKQTNEDALNKARSDSVIARSEMDRKKAEILEFEVRLKQAKRRVEAEEARLKRVVSRAKAELDRAEELRKKGSLPSSELEVARSRYDDLMFQLDPKYVPAPAPPPATDAPGPQGARADAKPALAVKIAGRGSLFASQTNRYEISVSNPGTAPAEKVEVTVPLPSSGGRLVAKPDGARFDRHSRTLSWTLGRVEPSRPIALAFDYLTSTPGLYKVTAEVNSGHLKAKDSMTTEVSGIAVVAPEITQTSRVIDVGKTNFYEITIKNAGSKEATRLQLRGNLTKDKLRLLKHYNIEKGEFRYDVEAGDFAFPEIDRLAVGQSVTLSLEAQATASGPAGCHVFLTHAESGPLDAPVEDMISTTIAGVGKP